MIPTGHDDTSSTGDRREGGLFQSQKECLLLAQQKTPAQLEMMNERQMNGAFRSWCNQLLQLSEDIPSNGPAKAAIVDLTTYYGPEDPMCAPAEHHLWTTDDDVHLVHAAIPATARKVVVRKTRKPAEKRKRENGDGRGDDDHDDKEDDKSAKKSKRSRTESSACLTRRGSEDEGAEKEEEDAEYDEKEDRGNKMRRKSQKTIRRTSAKKAPTGALPCATKSAKKLLFLGLASDEKSPVDEKAAGVRIETGAEDHIELEAEIMSSVQRESKRIVEQIRLRLGSASSSLSSSLAGCTPVSAKSGPAKKQILSDARKQYNTWFETFATRMAVRLCGTFVNMEPVSGRAPRTLSYTEDKLNKLCLALSRALDHKVFIKELCETSHLTLLTDAKLAKLKVYCVFLFVAYMNYYDFVVGPTLPAFDLKSTVAACSARIEREGSNFLVGDYNQLVKRLGLYASAYKLTLLDGKGTAVSAGADDGTIDVKKRIKKATKTKRARLLPAPTEDEEDEEE